MILGKKSTASTERLKNVNKEKRSNVDKKIHVADMKTYVTGSVDRTCKLWDVRAEKAKQTFFGHEADVNSVCVS